MYNRYKKEIGRIGTYYVELEGLLHVWDSLLMLLLLPFPYLLATFAAAEKWFIIRWNAKRNIPVRGGQFCSTLLSGCLTIFRSPLSQTISMGRYGLLLFIGGSNLVYILFKYQAIFWLNLSVPLLYI